MTPSTAFLPRWTPRSFWIVFCAGPKACARPSRRRLWPWTARPAPGVWIRDQSVKYIVSAWAEGNSLVLGQLKVADKSNEITAVPELLRVLELSGCIVTMDAMGCQKKIAREIIEADADYVLALKGNQETVHEEVKTFLDADLGGKTRAAPAGSQTVPSGGQPWRLGRRWKRITAAWKPAAIIRATSWTWFADLEKWEGLKSVGMVEAVREIRGRKTTERRYYLSSLPLGVETFARAVRGHWGVENKLHWVMDVHFREDQSRARAGYAAENLATLRRLAFNLLKSEKTKKRGIRGKQLNASWDHAYLLRLLGI